MSDISSVNLSKIRPLVIQHQKQSPPKPELKKSTEQEEALDRIQLSTRQSEEMERDLQRQSEMKRETYYRQSADEEARSQGTLETQKNKGNEELRELQNKQQAELNRLKREGDHDIARAQNYYKDQFLSTQRKGDQELEELKKNLANSSQFEQKRHFGEFELTHTENERNLNQNQKDMEEKYLTLHENSQKQYQDMKTNALTASEQADQKFQEKYQETLQNQNIALINLENQATQTLAQLRQDHSEKLEAYANRQSDPFYKLIHLNIGLEENEDTYVLRANIPEHEREHLSIAIRGNQVVISGRRRNEEKLELSPNHEISTASYQSFSESLPLGTPVDGKALTRSFEGEQLVVRIPKIGKNHPYEPYRKPEIEKAKYQKPNFPDHLPRADTLSMPAKNDKPLT